MITSTKINMHSPYKGKSLKLLLIVTLMVILLKSFSQSHYAHRHTKLQNIHRSMKKRDLFRIFGVENENEVPDYEITTPLVSNINYNTRMRRDINNNNNNNINEKPMNFNFALSAFDMDFHLNLSLNKHLLGPNFKIEIKGRNGTIQEKDSKHCHYVGNVKNQKNSVAALSTCKGLSGLFSTNKHDYFIEPVPDYLHKVQIVSSNMEKPHIVFRRSLESIKDETPSNILSKVWSKGSKSKHSCGTQSDPQIRFERSTDDISNLVKVDNSEKYIETLVVVDQKMVNYHGEDAATQFALVVLNIVSSLLRDGSIGSNLLILVVAKLELHTVDVPGLIINHHARNTLDSFGSWAARASDQDDRSDDHYDYAILLTRYNICADDKQPCDMLGLTQTGGMCNWPYSASVNEDNGLPLAYTVTHSIGHSLGMNHDGDESSFICPDNAYIMSSSITQDWKDTRNLWSRCSRNYLRQFLKKPQAHCLNDLPVKEKSVDYHKMDNKPGILYEVSKQCEMQFGTGSKTCSKPQSEDICWKLSCTNPLNANKCFTSIYPAADGTPCNQDKWCFRGKCVSTGDISSTDGGWSSWSDDYSPCSRSCSGGVQYRIRHCNHPKPSNGGKYCEGDTRFYRLCNTKACPNSLLTHRNTQCSKLNNRLFGERKFEWEFKPSKIDSCKLGCFISGTGHGYDFGNVEDGTNCDQMDDCVFCDKCINGACVSVGCDGKLGSHAKFDRCGVCNGDGSSCSAGTERSVIPDGNGGGGIVDALKSLKEMGFDMGNLYGHSVLDLSSKRSGVPGSKDSNNEFGWARLKSGCSVSCGGGFETVTAECRRQDDGSPVNEEKCDQSLKPPTQQYPCKEEACPPVWQTSYWGDCSKTCNGGYKKRNVRCVQKSGNGIEYDIDGSLCTGSRPTDTEGCNKEPCPAEWIAQPFGECSTICGPGVQVRDVLCQRTLKDGSLKTESESECRKDVKPPKEQKCNAHNPCPGDAGCGGIYTDSRGNFSSPSYPNDYPNNIECVHIIQVQEGKVIQLDFEKMSIVADDERQCRNDFVKVMDGDCVSRLGESKFCGKTIPPPFISTTNRLCVKFFSDDSQNDEGFVAKYHTIEKPAQTQDVCGSNITAPAGLISSPNYPEYYPANEDCNITISTEERPIKISFHAFDVGSDDCSTDYVYLSGGEENKKYCGQKVPPSYVSKVNPVVVQFVSTNHAATLKPGFVATYTSGKSQEAVSTRSEADGTDDKKMPPLEDHKDVPPENHNKTEKQMDDMRKQSMKKVNNGNEEEKKSVIPQAPVLQKGLHPQRSGIPSIDKHNEADNEANFSEKGSNDTKMPPLEDHKDVPPENHNKTEKQMDDMRKQSMKTTYNDSDAEKKSFVVQPAPSQQKQATQQKDMSFVQSTNDNDHVEKDIIQSTPDLSPEKKAYLDAIKDDTPEWIPEAEDYAKRSQINHANNTLPSSTKPRQQSQSTQKSGAQQMQRVKQPQHANNAVKQVIQQAAPVAKVMQPRQTFYVQAAPITTTQQLLYPGEILSTYEHNLDGQRGTCPNSNDLKCIRVLLSYPCTSDFNCRSGFACCPTSCAYGTKMCTPKVTKHCPLRDPFYYPRISCRTEADCPNSSPCCLDMGNQRYCRHMLTDNWGK